MTRALIYDHHSGLWVIAYTERVVRTCAAVFTAAYEQYKLWYVTADTIGLSRCLDMDMAVVLRSRSNVCEIVEMFEVIDSTELAG